MYFHIFDLLDFCVERIRFNQEGQNVHMQSYYIAYAQ